MADAFSESRKQPDSKQLSAAKRRMMREKQVVEIVERAHASIEERFNMLATVVAESGGIINAGSSARWAEDAEAARNETNWFPDWDEVTSLRDGYFKHKYALPSI